MARGLNGGERRQAGRVTPERTPWKPLALLRPGQEVRLLNVSRGGALVESATRMLPGGRTELQLSGLRRQTLAGRIARCRVTRIDPVRYEGAIVFDEALECGAAVSATGESTE